MSVRCPNPKCGSTESMDLGITSGRPFRDAPKQPRFRRNYGCLKCGKKFWIPISQEEAMNEISGRR